jgi:hypothetical protein
MQSDARAYPTQFISKPSARRTDTNESVPYSGDWQDSPVTAARYALPYLLNSAAVAFAVAFAVTAAVAVRLLLHLPGISGIPGVRTVTPPGYSTSIADKTTVPCLDGQYR